MGGLPVVAYARAQVVGDQQGRARFEHVMREHVVHRAIEHVQIAVARVDPDAIGFDDEKIDERRTDRRRHIGAPQRAVRRVGHLLQGDGIAYVE